MNTSKIKHWKPKLRNSNEVQIWIFGDEENDIYGMSDFFNKLKEENGEIIITAKTKSDASHILKDRMINIINQTSFKKLMHPVCMEESCERYSIIKKPGEFCQECKDYIKDAIAECKAGTCDCAEEQAIKKAEQ